MSTSRREFLQTSALAATGAALASRRGSAAQVAANDRVRMGFIGVGNRGSYLLDKFVEQPDVELLAISDVYEPYATRERDAIHPRWAASGKTPRGGEPHPESVGFHRDFLDCVKSRGSVVCPLEEGHRSTSFAHLANIALETRSRLEWDPKTERVTNVPEANALLHYEYRQPWSLG